MVEIRNGEDLERWLGDKPVLWRNQICYRFALRIVCGIGNYDDALIERKDWRNRQILHSMHQLIKLSINPFDETSNNITINRKFHLFDIIRNNKRTKLNLIFFLISTACEGLKKWNQILIWSDDGIKKYDVLDVLTSINPELPELLTSISLDCTALETGVDVWSQPLWLDDTPEWAVRGWETLATELTKRAPYWKTLVRWYEDRLHGDDWAAAQGRPAIPELEIARANLPDSYWKKGGKAVNQAIAKLEDYFWNGVEIDDPVLRELVGQKAEPIADIEIVEAAMEPPSELSTRTNLPLPEAIPAQTTFAIRYDAPADGPIDLAVPTADERLMDDPARLEDFAELRHKATDLASEGINRLGRLGVPLDRFLAIGEDLLAIRAKLLWSRINTFRIVLQGHRAAMEIAARGGERDERQLDGVVADKLTDLVETANLFVTGDPHLLELDGRRSDPQELAEAKVEVATIANVVRVAATNPEITSPQAGDEAVVQAENVARADDTLAGRQSADLGQKSTRNYVAALISRALAILRIGKLSKGAGAEGSYAWKEFRGGFYKAAGAGVFAVSTSELTGFTHYHIDFLKFIAANADALIAYIQTAFNNVDAVAVIQIIAAMF